MLVPLGGTLAVQPPLLEPLKEDMGPNKYPLYKVYMGLIIKDIYHPKGFPTIFPMTIN